MRRFRLQTGGRVAGTENFKLEYAPDYPTVTIEEAHPGRLMTPEQLEAMNLLASPEPAKAIIANFPHRSRRRSGEERQWPSYEMALAKAPLKRDGTGRDRSNADIRWCCLALSNGWSREETEAMLPDVSECALERVRGGDPGYIRVTVDNAWSWLERNRTRSRA